MPKSSSKQNRDDSEHRIGATDERAQASLESEDLAQLVWKYFEDVIRGTLIEVSNEKVKQE
jgi:hypothetical protein